MKFIYALTLFFLFFKAEAQITLATLPLYVSPDGYFTGGSASECDNGQLSGVATPFIINQQAIVTKVQIVGIQFFNNDLLLYSKGLKLKIYTDNNGLPSGNPLNSTGDNPIVSIDIDTNSPAYSLTEEPFVPMNKYIYTVDLAAINVQPLLQPNTKYWLYFVAKFDFTEPLLNSLKAFYWLRSAPNALMEAKTVRNLPGSNYPTWASFDVGTVGGMVYTVEGISSLGVNEVLYDSTGITVYPNPTSDFVYIKSGVPVDEVMLYDTTGKSLPIVYKDHKIDIQHLVSGVYFLKLKAGSQTFTKKIVKAAKH